MKWIKFFVLILALTLVGCSTAPTGSAGDENDPAVSGSDDAQMSGEGEGNLGGGANAPE